MQRYVLGVAFTEDGRVAMIRKNRPAWQNGKINFPGGKIEPGELPQDAIKREWKKEVGQHIARADWEVFARLREDEAFEVVCLRTPVCANPSEHALDNLGMVNGPEHCVLVTAEQLDAEVASGTAVENCPWILRLAMDWERRKGVAVIPYHDPKEAPDA